MNCLHFASFSGSDNYELVKFFVEKGINIYLKTENGMNCLHVAASMGCLNLSKAIVNKHNFNINLTDKNGLTALHHSAKNGNYELIKFFVDKGVDIYLKTKDGENCFHIAALE